MTWKTTTHQKNINTPKYASTSATQVRKFTPTRGPPNKSPQSSTKYITFSEITSKLDAIA